MPSCAAYNCTNRSSKESEISFHRVPAENRNKPLRARWIQIIRRKDNLPSGSFYICSTHFEDDCFKRNLQVFIFSLII